MIGQSAPDEVVLKVENLGKRFKIYPSQGGRIREWLSLGRHKHHRDFWCLQDISFQVRKGEFVGIIGPNGAGKSTLLKIITGVLDASAGSYSISGKVLSLLELSGGMDNDLTGRENVIRSAQLLGFPNSFAKERMQQIANFAELGEFFDAPLSTYSSGMRIRLAFSLFASLDCDILILDEVLAVGDIFFRQKCYARLEELIKQNTAIVLVTHSTGTVMRYCKSVIVLKEGRILFHGAPDQAVQKYFQVKEDQGVYIRPEDTFVEEDYFPNSGAASPSTEPAPVEWPAEIVFSQQSMPKKTASPNAVLTQLVVCDEDGKPRQVFRQGEKACFYFAYQLRENIGVPVAGISLTTETNLLIHSKNTIQHSANVPLKLARDDIFRCKQTIKLDLRPGKYIFNLQLTALHPDDYSALDTLSAIDLKEKQVQILSIRPAGLVEIAPANINDARDLHGGLCNLNGEFYVQVLSSNGTALVEPAGLKN
jgi:lipopolysaccharide transport system ATP-binding protein